MSFNLSIAWQAGVNEESILLLISSNLLLNKLATSPYESPAAPLQVDKLEITESIEPLTCPT